MKCAIYARYSSDLQNPKSAADQIEECRQFANSRGWRVIQEHIYADEGLSGESFLNRPALLALLKAAERRPPPFELLLVEDTGRISRRWGKTQDVVDRLAFFWRGGALRRRWTQHK